MLLSDIRHIERSKGRRSIWTCRLVDDEVTVFDDAWISLKCLTEESAAWLADVLSALWIEGVLIPRTPQQEWRGDLYDDCVLEGQHYLAHAEHLSGPFGKGGIWSCSLHGRHSDVVYSAEQDIQLRSGSAARWLAEILLLAVEHGIIIVS